MKIIKTIIADDHKIIRDGLKSLLESKPSTFKIVGEAKNGQELLDHLQKEEVDLVILDISMSPVDGIEATEWIKCNQEKTKVLILSMHGEKHFIISALKAKADGYLLKECAFEELLVAIQTIFSDKIFLSSTINDLIIRDYLNKNINHNNNLTCLSPRETEILKFIAEGLSTKEIAHKLNISPKTIESHRKQIMEKLNLNSTALLIRYAIKEGISPL